MPDKGYKSTPKVIAKEQEINLLYPESGNLHRRLIETVRSGIFLGDAQGKLSYVNHAFVEILGRNTKDELIGVNFFDAVLSDPMEREDFVKRLYEAGSVRDFQFQHQHKEGHRMVISVTGNCIYNDRSEIIGFEGVVQDVTAQKRLEEELLTEKRKLEQILAFDEQISTIREYNQLIDFIVEKTAVLLEAQKCSLMLLDKDGKGLFIQGAKGLSEQVIKESHIRLGEMVAGYVAQSRTPMLVQNIEYDERFKRASRPYYFTRSFMSVPLALENKLIGVINVSDQVKGKSFNEVDLRILGATAREVAIALENMEIYQHLNYLTITDPLTLIYNYRQFTQSLNFEIKRRQRVPGNLCLILIDIDTFKAYNDTWGHLGGDALLKEIGKIFKSQLRETDIVCRYAGDEFGIILPDITIDGAQVAAEKIRQAVERTQFKMPVTISLGVAAYTPGLTQHEFILKADRALYEAKREGKNRVRAQA